MDKWKVIQAQPPRESEKPSPNPLPPKTPTYKRKKSRTKLLVILSVVGLVLIAGLGVGGWFIYKKTGGIIESEMLHQQLMQQIASEERSPKGNKTGLFKRISDIYQGAADRTAGNESAYCHNVAIFFNKLNTAQNNYHKEVGKFAAMGSIRAASAKSPQELQRRLDQLKQVVKAEQKWENWVGNSLIHYTQQLSDAHVDTTGVYTLTEIGFFTSMSARNMDLAKDERDLLKLYRRRLLLLKNHWGQWRYDPKINKVLFNHGSPLLSQFNDTAKRIHQDVQDEHAIRSSVMAKLQALQD